MQKHEARMKAGLWVRCVCVFLSCRGAMVLLYLSSHVCWVLSSSPTACVTLHLYAPHAQIYVCSLSSVLKSSFGPVFVCHLPSGASLWRKGLGEIVPIFHELSKVCYA